jgi:hypothetical protein
MKFYIRFNKKINSWLIYINKNIFLTFLNKRINYNKYSNNINNYYYLLRILRQIGLIKKIKNNKNY